MPSYMVQRPFPRGLLIAVANGGVDICRARVERNADHGVTWIHSYVSADNRTNLPRLRRAGTEANRETAARNSLPVDRITQVRVLDPYFHPGEGV